MKMELSLKVLGTNICNVHGTITVKFFVRFLKLVTGGKIEKDSRGSHHISKMLSERMSTVKINDFKKGQDPETNEEVLIFDPYNPVNKEITEEEVRGLLTRFGIPESVPIHNMALYRRAFVHRSYVRKSELDNMERNVIIVPKPDDCMALKTKSNDRLEFVGDGVLE